jgi:hypothetical protein
MGMGIYLHCLLIFLLSWQGWARTQLPVFSWPHLLPVNSQCMAYKGGLLDGHFLLCQSWGLLLPVVRSKCPVQKLREGSNGRRWE